MRTFVLLLFLITTYFLGCSQKEKQKGKDYFNITSYRELSINDTLRYYIEEYLHYVREPGNFVYQLFIQQKPDTITYYLNFARYRADISKYWPPSGYFRIDNKLLLFYNGNGFFFKNDQFFIESLQKELSGKYLPEIGQLPFISEIRTWRIDYSINNGKYFINKHTYCPFFSMEPYK